MPHHPVDLMIDVETLGTSRGAAIVQVGWCFFNRKTGFVSEPFRHFVEPSAEAAIDYATVRWWMQQAEEARGAVFSRENSFQTESLVAVQLSTLFSKKVWDEVCVWAMPPSFDLALLESLFERAGAKPPWRHYNTRCLRTLMDLAGMGKESRTPRLVAHDAGCDAVAQAHDALKCMRKLKGG